MSFGTLYIKQKLDLVKPFHVTKKHSYSRLNDKHIIRRVNPEIDFSEALKDYAAEKVFEYFMPRDGQKFAGNSFAHLLKPVNVCLTPEFGVVILEGAINEIEGPTTAKEVPGIYQGLQKYGIEFNPAEKVILKPDELADLLGYGNYHLTETSGRVHPEALRYVSSMIPIQQDEALRKIAVAYVLGATAEYPVIIQDMHTHGLLKKKLTWQDIQEGSMDMVAKRMMVNAKTRFGRDFKAEPFDWENGSNIADYSIPDFIFKEFKKKVEQQRNNLEGVLEIVARKKPLSMNII